LAHDRHGLTRRDVVRQPAHHASEPAPGTERHIQVADGEHAHLPTSLPAMAERCFGSRTSRSPSPSMLNASTTTKMATPGKTAIHQACSMNPRPSESIRPQDGLGAWTPRPRKLSAASDRIANARLIEVCTISGAAMF